jgi:hypothetical protein
MKLNYESCLVSFVNTLEESDNTVQFQIDQNLRRIHGNKRNGYLQGRNAGFTVGGTSAAAAIRNQTVPLRTRTRQWIESGTAKGDHPIPTWFQTRLPELTEPPLSRRRRSNPTSMIMNKTVSKRREMTMLVLLSSELRKIQARKVGSQADRSCGWISLDGRKQLR